MSASYSLSQLCIYLVTYFICHKSRLESLALRSMSSKYNNDFCSGAFIKIELLSFILNVTYTVATNKQKQTRLNKQAIFISVKNK